MTITPVNLHAESAYVGLAADGRPSAAAVGAGTYFFEIDTPKVWMSDGTAWWDVTPTGGGGGAPSGPAGGDLTGTYPNPTIALLAVTTAKIAAGAVTEPKLTLADVTTGNVSTATHGFVPKAPNVATQYLDGTGAWSTPAGAVASVTGTANQVTAAPTTGAVVLTLPQNIHTGAAPTFAGLTITGQPVAINLGAVAAPTELSVGSTINTSPRGIMSWQASTDVHGARLHLRKTRGTFAAPSIIVSGDDLGRIVATGYDGASYLEMANILVTSEGTIAANRIPTRLTFWTATDAAPSVLTERLRIDSAGLSTFTGTLAITGGTVVVSTPLLNATQTWNAVSVTFTGLKVNVTDTASAAASLLMDLQVAGASKFSVRKDGLVNIAGAVLVGGVVGIGYIGTGDVTIPSAGRISFGSSGVNSPDAGIYRDAANTLAQRNGANAQAHRWYNTFTTLNTAGEWASANWTDVANQFTITTKAGSTTGTTRAMLVGAGTSVGTDIAGATTTIQGGISTGAGLGGSIIFNLTNKAGTGTGANTTGAVLTLAPPNSGTTAPVNGLTITAAITTASPSIAATGSDTNISLTLTPKGTGQVLIPDGATATPSIAFSSQTTTGLYKPNSGTLAVAVASVNILSIYATGLGVGSGTVIGWTSTTDANLSIDTGLARNAAGLAEINNGTAGTLRDLTLRDLFTNDATYIVRTKTTLTDGAAAGAGTLTNAPASGNPTKWIAIDDNGTKRQIPAW